MCSHNPYIPSVHNLHQLVAGYRAVAGISVTFGDWWLGSFLHSVTAVTGNLQ